MRRIGLAVVSLSASHLRRSPPRACLLVNAAHIKQVPGRKTDVKDCVWIRAMPGAWTAAGQSRAAAEQRCWVHRIANSHRVNRMPCEIRHVHGIFDRPKPGQEVGRIRF